ncbi:MAG TPA: hypothetical protein PKI19_08290 [Elusimicrobiales bacterium]|nr:hypothetical protein [Elusimicrobiales bacterium]
MINRKILLLLPALLLGACTHAVKEPPVALAPLEPAAPALRRVYTEGEILNYRMNLEYSTTGEDTVTAVSSAAATVKKRADGIFYESWQWTGRQKNGTETKLPPESRDFRQLLSLDPAFKLAAPDLTAVFPLSQPATDTLAFYTEVQLAVRTCLALKPGEHVFIEHGKPNSWEGGATLTGRDCINFDLTLTGVDPDENTATLKALRVPPAGGCGPAPAAWMEKPVSDAPNNWYQVRKEGRSVYIAGAATETYEDEIKLSLADGHITSATQLNRVTGEKRTCTDERLTRCNTPGKFAIVRKIALSEVK